MVITKLHEITPKLFTMTWEFSVAHLLSYLYFIIIPFPSGFNSAQTMSSRVGYDSKGIGGMLTGFDHSHETVTHTAESKQSSYKEVIKIYYIPEVCWMLLYYTTTEVKKLVQLYYMYFMLQLSISADKTSHLLCLQYVSVTAKMEHFNCRVP